MHAAKNSLDFKAKLEDLQVLHQQNELVFKHNYVGGADNLDIDDAALEDEAYIPGTLIWSLDLKSRDNGEKMSINTNLTNVLCIFETHSCL